MRPLLALGLAALIVPGGGVGVYFVRRAAIEEAAKEKHADAAMGRIVRTYRLDGSPAFDLEEAASVASWSRSTRELAADEELATGEVVLAPGSTHDVRAAFAGVVGAGDRALALSTAVQAGDKLAVLAPLVTP